MRMRSCPRWASIMALLALLTGCDRGKPLADETSNNDAPAATQLADTTAPEPEPPVRLPEADNWTAAEALERLADDDPRTQISAAVRLVRLAEVTAFGIPDPLPNEIADLLTLRRIGSLGWALGWRGDVEHRLWAPVFIAPDGEIIQPFGDEEHDARVHVSRDTNLFPHLALTDSRVWVLRGEPALALAGESLRGARFAHTLEHGRAQVELHYAAAGELQSIAKWLWDPLEGAFLGPLADELPDKPGVLWELDIDDSDYLIPVGGHIPKPKLERPNAPEPVLPPM